MAGMALLTGPGPAVSVDGSRRNTGPAEPGLVLGRLRHGRLGRFLQTHPKLVDGMLAAGLSLVVFAALLNTLAGASGTRQLTVLGLAALELLLVVWRRQFPIVVLGACLTAAGVQALIGSAVTSNVAVLVAFYTVAAQGTRRARRAATALMAVAAVVGSIAWHAENHVRIPTNLSLLGLVVVTVGVLGRNAGTRRAYLASLTDRADRLERERDQQAQIAAAAERARIAREMHDVVAHNLSVMIALADGAEFVLDSSAPQAKQAITQVSRTGREALAEMRRLLGVLRAGGAFVPLDASWPARRLDEVADGARIAAVITADGSAVPASPAIASTRVFQLDPTGVLVTPVDTDPDHPAPPLAGTAAADADSGVEMENLAYVAYTSGSTGTPKGVAIRHQAICNRLRWQVDLLRLTGDDVVLHRSPLDIDIAVNEIFLPLIAGARLVVAPPGTQDAAGALLEIIHDQAVTFIYVTTSMLAAMLDHPGGVAAGRSLRYVWCGGEVMDDAMYRRFRERWQAWMFHGYGPAEATIGVSCRVYEPATAAAHVSIGRPNPNAQVRVLDAEYDPVPVGTVGELFIGGLPLARGYLDDSRRTADRFVPDPFSKVPGSRMYATGDLARFRADGEIEFVGRADGQVKIRGFRVELAEIEQVLRRHPAVRDAEVVLAPGEDGADELLAYWVSAATPTREAADPRVWLAERLPAHMVPAAVVPVAQLPMGGVRADRVVPADDVARHIARAWSEVLDLTVTTVDARDDFFALGGHSLLLTGVQARLERRLGRPVPLLDLYTHPTVEGLARRLAGDSFDRSGRTGGPHRSSAEEIL
ncbi:amino acid adenylation domain-containing protein [Frankia sp. AgKG'84/4]|uniref:amino acid adenylation domain-containing protein n=1 Tax=Frankia sp. AgKG'84/4 TaxID=573490 RepID=UPI00202A4BDE|nr:amino acid adenylation domain-containing protein [Frankia sp. AgKG'84/4]MCL9792819.1 amino acid adenylation domain-containing protein [Frankia sp. AgKG'84/4]